MKALRALAAAALGLAVASAVAASPALAGGRTLTVMTRNVYLGADLAPILAAPSLEDTYRRAGVAWARVEANDFGHRARALAAEIAAAKPDVVGLQEAMLFRSDRPADGSDSPAETVVQDYLRLLVKALKARGERYRVVATFRGGDAEMPLGAPAVMDGRITDRVAMLVRAGPARRWLHVRKAVARTYDAGLTAVLGGGTLRLPRGWIAATLVVRAVKLVIVSTHLESADPQVRAQQARGAARERRREEGPVVLLGDFNSGPGTDTTAYDVLRAGGFDDAWARVHGAALGLTCCFAEDLRSTAKPLSSRIDLVLFKNGVRARRVDVVGEASADRVSGLWPSDHAGLIARPRLPN